MFFPGVVAPTPCVCWRFGVAAGSCQSGPISPRLGWWAVADCTDHHRHSLTQATHTNTTNTAWLAQSSTPRPVSLISFRRRLSSSHGRRCGCSLPTSCLDYCKRLCGVATPSACSFARNGNDWIGLDHAHYFQNWIFLLIIAAIHRPPAFPSPASVCAWCRLLINASGMRSQPTS